MRTSITRLLGLVLITTLAAAGCDRKTATTAPPPADAVPANVLELTLLYGSEKQAWLEPVTARYNAENRQTPDGKTVRVKLVAMGSGESAEELLAGRVQAHLWSPASGVFVKLANAKSQVKGTPLVGPTKELVLSPVVIAMWKPMAEALGWPAKPIGWADVIALAKDGKGWAGVGRPEFGPFKFGHTHPDYSNSGLIAILAEAYAATGKVRDLSAADLDDPKVGRFIGDVERSVVHYGRSTGFFGKRLAEDGPGYLSAAVLYENMVVESYATPGPTPLVAIYPKEGTFWSDHPVGVVEREWVTPAHRAAAAAFVDYLRAPPQQAEALARGFRPAEGAVAAPIDAAHGVDPAQPMTVLELPSAPVVDRVVELWRRNKKHANVALVFDQSGSMGQGQMMPQAQRAAAQFIGMLGDDDSLALVPFSGGVTVVPGGPMKTARADLLARVNALVPHGDTHLYEAIAAAQAHLRSNPRPDCINAIVVMTDGEDNGKRPTLDELLQDIQDRGEGGGGDVRIFCVGYGSSARLDDLKRVAKKSHGEQYQGKPETIRSVFVDIATFF